MTSLLRELRLCLRQLQMRDAGALVVCPVF
jgi:hypothetical protein